MATINPNHAFNLASPYAAEMQEMQRRQQMSEMLQKQSQSPFERFSYQGIEAPIPFTAGLAKILQAYTGAKMQREGVAEQKALGQRYKTETMDTLSQAQAMREGTPEQPARQGIDAPTDDLGGGPGFPNQAAIPAIAPNIQGSANLLMGSNNPMLMQMGLTERQDAIKSQRMADALKQAGYGTPPPAVTQPIPSPPTSATGQTAPAPTEVTVGGPIPLRSAAPNQQAASTPAGGQSGAMVPQSGINPQSLALLKALAMSSGDPSILGKIAELEQGAFAKQNEPIVSRENAPILKWNANTGKYDVAFSPSPKLGEGMQWNFSTGSASTAPGYADALQTQQRNTANVAAESTIVDVPFSDGTSQKMPLSRARELYPQMYGTTPMVTGGALRGQVPTPGAAQAAVDQNSGIDRPASVGVSPMNRQLGVNPALAAGNIERAKLVAKGEIERIDQFKTTYKEATSMLNNLELLEALASDPNVASGTLANDISSIKSLATSLGMATPAGLPAEEAIRAITTQMALQAKTQGGTNMMPGAMSNFEQKMLQSMTPQLAQSREGRQLMIGVFRVKAQRDRLISEMAGEYEDKFGKLDSGFDKQLRAFSKANPMWNAETANALIEMSKRLTTGAR